MMLKVLIILLAMLVMQITAKTPDPEQELLKKEAKEAKRYNKYLAGKLHHGHLANS